LLPLSNAGHVFFSVWGAFFAVAARILLLAALPWLDRSAPGKAPGFTHKLLILILALDVILLCVWAMQPPSLIGGILLAVFTVYYFLHFIVLVPLTTALEAG
jgi:ubiquinol-cytochrome c reductase cytochrome b subunit